MGFVRSPKLQLTAAIMANIRITCPACKSELEIDSQFEGQDVECGSCLEVFKARKPDSDQPAVTVPTPASKRSKPADPPQRKKRQRDDDDDYERDRRRDDYEDDDYYYAPPESRKNGGNGVAIASLILGIISIFPGCCCGIFGLPLSIGAIVTGVIGMNSPGGRGMSVAGLTLGIISIGFAVLALILRIGLMANNPGQFG
jgi:predicted Zn finger-like uncharacterized protein